MLKGAEDIPERVVALTFDDAYESVYTEAYPRLSERGWPYTVFANTDAIDAGHSPYMSWAKLRELAEDHVAIENHSAAHAHMSRPEPGESERDWRRRVRADIQKAHGRIAEEIGTAPELFAYPYGEDSPALAEVVAEDHEYGLAQRSGPVGPLTDPLSIPRFPMATGFASLDRLELAVRSRPLPVSETKTRPAGAVERKRRPRKDRSEDRSRRFSGRPAQLLCRQWPATRDIDGRDGPLPCNHRCRRCGYTGAQQDQLHRPGGRRQRRFLLVLVAVAGRKLRRG